jgi:hypothetical protein
MLQMIDGRLPGGFLPTICGRFGSNVLDAAAMAPKCSKQDSNDEQVKF